jgi:protein SCO1/2
VSVLALTSCAGTAASARPGGQRLAFRGTDVTGTVTLPAVALSDTGGHPVDLAALPPEAVTAIFFGYTRCGDVCPATAADLAAARRRLPAPDRARFGVVFVDVDPGYDRPVLVRSWLDRFDSSFTGALGSRAATDAVLAAVHAPTTTDAGGEPAHTGLVYLFGRGRALVYTGGATGSDYAQDVATLLRA